LKDAVTAVFGGVDFGDFFLRFVHTVFLAGGESEGHHAGDEGDKNASDVFHGMKILVN
jgi:hypothetical protein